MYAKYGHLMELEVGIYDQHWSITDAIECIHPKQEASKFRTRYISPKDILMSDRSVIKQAVEATGALTAALESAHFPSPITQGQDVHMAALNKLAHSFNAAVKLEKKSMENRKTVLAQLPRMEIEKAVENSPSPRVEAEKEVDTTTPPRVIVTDNTGQPESDAPHINPADSGGNTPRVRVPRRIRTTALHVIPDNTGMGTEIHHKVEQQKQQGPQIVPDLEKYETTMQYIHKYNTRSAPKYAFRSHPAVVIYEEYCGGPRVYEPCFTSRYRQNICI